MENRIPELLPIKKTELFRRPDRIRIQHVVVVKVAENVILPARVPPQGIPVLFPWMQLPMTRTFRDLGKLSKSSSVSIYRRKFSPGNETGISPSLHERFQDSWHQNESPYDGAH